MVAREKGMGILDILHAPYKNLAHLQEFIFVGASLVGPLHIGL
jgi:hypothetical protein